MDTNERLALMKEVKQNIIDYLQGQLDINLEALKPYEEINPLQNLDPKVKEMREMEAMKLRAIVHDLRKHIAVINKMVITGK